jgi:hypothetical protein
MTVYLWHMLVLVALLSLLHVLDLDLPVRIESNGQIVPDGLGYWAWLALVAAVFVLCVYAVARWLWPIEFVHLPWFDAPPGRATRSEWLAGSGSCCGRACSTAGPGSGLLRPHGVRDPGLDRRRAAHDRPGQPHLREPVPPRSPKDGPAGEAG